MSIMVRLRFVLLFAAMVLFRAEAVEMNEAVLEEGANGTAVVLLSVAHIQQAAIFPDDNEMLRRVAYVETKDGGRYGGVWAVSETAFENTKDVNNTLLVLKHEQIVQQFGVDWRRVQFSELRKPLYSALAARLVLFAAPRAIPSSTNVAAQAQFWRENYNSAGSVEDFIRATNQLQGAILDNSVSDFYVGFAQNDLVPGGVQQLFITTREPDPVPFTVQTLLGFNFTGVAVSNTTTVVPLGNTYQVLSSSERNKGIHVSAGDKHVAVYGLNYHKYTSDAFLALPCHLLAEDQYEYYGIAYDGIGWPSQLLFVGCENNTTVTIASTTIILNRMETYLFESHSDNTGTRIVSNKPVSFYSGALCVNIPVKSGGCDHITEQFPPTATWGTRFLSASFSSRMSGDIYRILTSQPSTNVTVNCTTYSQPETYSLATAGAWQEFNTPANSLCVVESNNPLLLVEFALGYNTDRIGDPFMTMIPPIEQYNNDYGFNVPSEFETNYITMFVSPEYFQPEKIFVDESSQEGANWTTIYCTDGTVCGHAAYASLEAGEHQLYHNDTSARIGLVAYGFSFFNSYGYSGGLQLTPLQTTMVSFSQEKYFIGESEEALRVSVLRTRNTESFVLVLVASQTNKGTAIAGQDYSTVIELLEFEPGVIEKEVDIDIIDDTIYEEDESISLYISSGVGTILSPFSQAELTIINNDKMFACPAEADNVWKIEWPYANINTLVNVPCRKDSIRNATRVCFSNFSWGDVDVNDCLSGRFISAQQRVEEVKDLESALEVVADLAEATTDIGVPQFPLDLEAINKIVLETIILLTKNLEERGDDKDPTALFKLLDNALDDNNRISYAILQESGRVGSEGVLYNVEQYALYLAKLLGCQVPAYYSITGDNIALHVKVVSVEDIEGYTFPGDEDIEGFTLLNTNMADIQLPQPLLKERANCNGSVAVASVLFRNIQTFLSIDKPELIPLSLVISSQVVTQGGDGEVDPVLVENPVILGFEFQLPENMSSDEVQCVFWNFGDNKTALQNTTWSGDGITTLSVSRDGDFVTVQCSSTHLTSFAVLVGVGGTQLHLEEEALRIVSYIGLAISLACLLLTIIFFLIFGKGLFSTVHNFVHLNLAIALFVGYLIFAVGVELAKDNEIVCKAVTALVQYFLLAAFCWMMCEGVMLYLMLVVVFSKLSKKWWFFCLLGWGIPVVFVVIGLGAVHDEYGVKDGSGGYKYCWLSSGGGTHAIWTFMAPMLAIIVINTVFLVLVLFNIFKHKAKHSKILEKGIRVDLVMSVVKASIILLPMLGLTWVFGLFAVNKNTVVFAWLFTILNTLQGLFIFFFQVVRSDRIWGKLKKKYGVPSTSKTIRSTISNGTSRYHAALLSQVTSSQLMEEPSISPSTDESQRVVVQLVRAIELMLMRVAELIEKLSSVETEEIVEESRNEPTNS